MDAVRVKYEMEQGAVGPGGVLAGLGGLALLQRAQRFSEYQQQNRNDEPPVYGDRN